MPKLSVIVPVYGVEKYIERCARSLFEQTLDDIEYIFIDDCTPDKSIEILRSVLEQYPKRKASVKIVKMPTNSGQAAVRRCGIKLTSGEYVIHCDSDDWIDINAYSKCYELAKQNNYDIVFFDYEKTDGISYKRIDCNISCKKEDLIGSLISGCTMGNLWSAMVRRDLYNKLEVYPEYNMNEDLVIALQLVYHAKNYSYIAEPFYKYNLSDTSITSSVKTKEKTISVFCHSRENLFLLFKYLQRHNLSEQYSQEIEARKVALLGNLAPYINDSDVWRLWHETNDLSTFSVLNNKLLSFRVKLIFVLSKLRLFPYLKHS